MGPGLSERPARVQLLPTCLVNEFFPEVGEAAASVLERAGVSLEVPSGVVCCGQPAHNAGFHAEARAVARHVIDVLESADGTVVVPSGSCADMLVHQYPRLLREDPAWHRRATDLAARVRELSQFLAEVPARPAAAPSGSGRFDARIAYHPSCHLLRGLGVRTQPLSLLAEIPGVALVPFPDQDECCGFGGIFSVKQPDISAAMLADKVRHVLASGAEVLVSCDMGCLMHLQGGLRRAAPPLRVKHLAQVLAESGGR